MASKFRWDDIQKKARKDGELEYAFDQSLPVETQGLTEPEDGYCVGLALRWIERRFRGKDYEYDPHEHLAQKSDYQALRAQYKSRETEGGPLARAEAVLNYFGISANRGRYTRVDRVVSADLLMNAVFAGDGLYYVEMRGQNEKGEHAHALAIQREGHGTTYRLFDSNEGHFVLKGAARFKEFLTWFLNTTPYNSDRFTPYSREYLKATYIVGVNPAK
jgi:hypothetical protein